MIETPWSIKGAANTTPNLYQLVMKTKWLAYGFQNISLTFTNNSHRLVICQRIEKRKPKKSLLFSVESYVHEEMLSNNCIWSRISSMKSIKPQ
jgi:hypothetical protein